MQPAGSVYQYQISSPRLSRLDGVKDDRSWIRVGLVCYDRRINSLTPYPKLVDRGSAKGIAGSEQDGSAMPLQESPEFGDAGRLAGAVHSDNQYCRAIRDGLQ